MSVNYKSHGRIDHIDCYVASKIKMRRLLLNLSQEVLANALGVSIQQIQKYEKGTNRISSANLYRIGKVLDVPMSYFFAEVEENLPVNASAAKLEDAYMSSGASEKEAFCLINGFNNIVCADAKKSILALVTILSQRE